jgi:hypothetical protein
VYSPIVGLDLSAAGPAALRLPLTGSFEHAALAVSGAARVAGEPLTPGTLLYLGTGREELALECATAARILLIGGAPFGEEILVWWNFVARTPAEMEAAIRDWNAGRFGAVTGSPAPPLIAPSLAGLNLRPAPGGAT